VTTGTAFNTAFAGGATISTGTIAASVAASVNFQAGLANMDVTFTVDADLMLGNAGGEDTTIVTGSGADTITFTGDSTYVGAAAGDGGTISVSSGSGIDTISITTGTILAQTNSQSVIVNAGTGADVITIVGVYADTVQSTALIVIDAGDSLTTARDTLTGADIATANLFGTGFDFTGTSTVGTLGTSNDFGTIATHNVTAGVVLFDDASTYAEELVINAANLADAVGYLNANSAALETFGFKYDSTGNGTADAFMIYNNNTTDSLIELVGVTAYDALVDSAASDAGDLFIA
jgi:fibronectin-binding autotransporter adhesin